MELDILLFYEKEISSLLKKQNDTFIILGGYLDDLKKSESYKLIPEFCKSSGFYDYVKVKFNIGSTTCKNLIAVCLRFGYLKTNLDEKYKKYSFSQLVEMISLSEEQLKLINYKMSVSEIKAIKKVYICQSSDQQSNLQKINNKQIKTTNYNIVFESEVFEKMRKYLKQNKDKTFDIFINELVKNYFKNVN